MIEFLGFLISPIFWTIVVVVLLCCRLLVYFVDNTDTSAEYTTTQKNDRDIEEIINDTVDKTIDYIKREECTMIGKPTDNTTLYIYDAYTSFYERYYEAKVGNSTYKFHVDNATIHRFLYFPERPSSRYIETLDGDVIKLPDFRKLKLVKNSGNKHVGTLYSDIELGEYKDCYKLVLKKKVELVNSGEYFFDVKGGDK